MDAAQQYHNTLDIRPFIVEWDSCMRYMRACAMYVLHVFGPDIGQNIIRVAADYSMPHASVFMYRGIGAALYRIRLYNGQLAMCDPYRTKYITTMNTCLHIHECCFRELIQLVRQNCYDLYMFNMYLGTNDTLHITFNGTVITIVFTEVYT